MALPVNNSPETMKALCETFKVSNGTSQYYGNFYEKQLLPRIRTKYLAHLIISIEEMIDEKLKKDSKKKSQETNVREEKPGESMGRKFTIALFTIDKLPKELQRPPGNPKAWVVCYSKCAVIYYEPVKETKKLRIFIGHELGHVLRHYDIIPGTAEIETHANTFAYFAISGKNKFYHEELGDLLYESEEEIISSIQEACPVNDFREVKHGSSKGESK